MDAVVYSTIINKYELYEKKSPSQYTRRCIDNTITGCNKCVGYCQYVGHPGFLTQKHRKEHNCLGKGCYYYIAKPSKEKRNSSSFGKEFSFKEIFSQY